MQRRTSTTITMSGDSETTMYEHPLVKRYATKVRRAARRSMSGASTTW